MNTKSLLFTLLVVIITTSLLLAACAPSASTPNPAAILEGYIHSFNARQLDEAISLVADDAVFIDPGGKYVGEAQIRATLQSAINDGVTLEVSNISDTNGRLVYEYKVFVGGGLFTSGTGLTIVQDGKIIFDGTEETWTEECNRDASQRFCVEK